MPDESHRLLALNAGTRDTGWAIFSGREIVDSGVITVTRARIDPAGLRILRLLSEVDDLVCRHQPVEVASGRPSGLRWEVPALELLELELVRWAGGAGLPLTQYPMETVRRAVVGNSRASGESLAFAVMTALGLVGMRKSTQEWGAAAIGAYHLCQMEGSSGNGVAG